MDEVIVRLSAIEEAASAVVSNAGQRWKHYEEKIHEEKVNFDQAVDRDTEAKLMTLRAKLEAENAAILAKLQEDTACKLAAMEAHFKEHHKELADQVVDRIIRG